MITALPLTVQWKIEQSCWLDLRYIVSPSLPQRSFNFIPHKQQWCTLVFV